VSGGAAPVLTSCPHCGSAAIAPWRHRSDGRSIWACADCALRFVREPFSDVSALYGEHYFDKSAGGGAIPEIGYQAYRELLPVDFRWHQALLRLFAPEPGALLDVGCATGRFLAAARSDGHRGRGVELSDYAATQARALGFEVASSLDELREPVDVITMWEVLEHVADLRGALVAARDRLVDGGLLLLSTPDTGAPAVVARGERWIGFRSSLEHLTYLTQTFLAPVLREIFDCEPLFVSAGADEFWTLVAIVRKGGLRPGDREAHRRLVARAGEREVAWFWFSLEDVTAAQHTLGGLRAAGQETALFEAVLALRRGDSDDAYARLTRLAEQSGWSSEVLQWLSRAASARLGQVDALHERLDSASEGRAAALDEVARLRGSAGYRIGRGITRVLEHMPYADVAWQRYDELYRVGVRGAIAARLPKLKSLAQTIRRRGAALSSVYTPLLARSPKVQYTAVQAGLTPDWVTVVIPVFDAAPFLGDAVESVLRQTYPRVEVVVVLDGANSAAAASLSRFERHPRVRVVVGAAEHDLAQALATGFELAQGELWTWLSADNLMEPAQLERMLAFLRSSAGVDLTYADYLAIDERGAPLRDPTFRPQNRRTPTDPEIHLPREASAFNPTLDDFIGPCFVYRGHVGLAIGDPVIATEDFDSWMRVRARFRIQHLGTDEILFRYRVHGNPLNARGGRLKIFDRVTNLVKYEAKRSEPARQPFVLEPDDQSGALAQQLVAPPRVVMAPSSSARRVALLAGDAGPPSILPDAPTVVWFSRDSIAPYRWASWLERANVVAIAPDGQVVERVLAAGGRGFSHEELGRALDVALTRLETPVTPSRDATIFRGSRPPPKIALEVQAFDKGGLEQVVVDLAIVLRAGGAIPIIVATGPVGSAGRRAERAGISVVELPAHNRDAAYADLIRREQIELINAHYSLTGAPIAARAELPFVQTIHNSYVWLSDAERRAYEDADPFTTAYVCVSMTAAQFSDAQLRLPAEKIVVLPNGIDTTAFQPVSAAERARLRQKHRISPDAFVFLNVAGLRDWKGQRQLILAFADVHRHAPSARLVIAGGGSDPVYRRALGEAIERNGLEDVVTLPGHTQSVEELYALADAFVLPSFFEGYSLALLEAACSGLPCIATDCGAAREVFARTTGILVPLPFQSLTEHDLYSLQRLVDADEPLRSRVTDAMLEVLAAPRPAVVTPDTRRRFDRGQTYARHRDLFDWLIAGGAPHAARRWLRARTDAAIAQRDESPAATGAPMTIMREGARGG